MSTDQNGTSLRSKLGRTTEQAVGKLAEEALTQPLVRNTVGRIFEARERALQVQETTMSLFNIPSAGDVDRLTRRLRTVSNRLESIEDSLDRLGQKVQIANAESKIDARLAHIEAQLVKLTAVKAAAKKPAASKTATKATTKKA